MARITRLGLLALLLLPLALGSALAQSKPFNVAVYFPGTLGGNPLEPPINAGVKHVQAAFPNVTAKVIEGGAASDWESGIMALAASHKYQLIITFTDGMPQILKTVSTLFPNQKYALLDSSAPDLKNVYSVVYSDEALGFLGGALAGLVATDPQLSSDVSSPTIGLLAGTPYPAMDNKIHPGFAAGAHYVDPSIKVLYAAVGSWNDPNKAHDLALNMFDRNASIIMPITGGGDTGVYRAATERKRYALGVNTDQNSLQPGVILGSVLKRIDISIYDVVKAAVAGNLAYGTVHTAGIEDGAISIADDALYQQYVPAAIRDKLSQIAKDIASGKLDMAARIHAELGH